MLLLDELHEPPQEELVVLANAIQDAGKASQAPLAIFAAGLPQTPELVMEATSFTERFDFRSLGRLDADAAERALVEPALGLQVHWDTDAAELAVQQAGGSPYLIQLIGEESWIQAHPDAGSSIGLQHVEAAAGEVGESLDNGMFRGRWAKAIPVEKAVIVDRRHRRRGRSCLDWGHLDCLGRAGSAVEHGASVADRQGHGRARRPRSAQVHDAGGLRRSWRRSAPRGRATTATWRVPCASDSRPRPQR